jgi:hypothetical protein
MPIHLTIHRFELYEVKISDVSLATCHAFDKEIAEPSGRGDRLIGSRRKRPSQLPSGR